jgi:hypothetical protein
MKRPKWSADTAWQSAAPSPMWASSARCSRTAPV